MKHSRILFVSNKTLNRNGTPRLEASYFNFYVAMAELGCVMEFYDTVCPVDHDFDRVVDRFKPTMVFSILTGNQQVTPHEPVKSIKNLTRSGLVKTFNWFCDDTWRYETFSKPVCRLFAACSTPEPHMVEQYRADGYESIHLGNWHVNESAITLETNNKYDVGFVGGFNSQRVSGLQALQQQGVRIGNIQGATHEDMLSLYCNSKIGVNFSVNENDPQKRTQMKLRMFEVPACRALLITQNHKGLEQFYVPGKEVEVFDTEEEMQDKVRFYLKNESSRKAIAEAGWARFMKEHTSRNRLGSLLDSLGV